LSIRAPGEATAAALDATLNSLDLTTGRTKYHLDGENVLDAVTLVGADLTSDVTLRVTVWGGVLPS